MVKSDNIFKSRLLLRILPALCILSLLFVGLISASTVHAAFGPLDFFNQLTFGLGGDNAEGIFFNAINWALSFAGFIAGVFVLKGGAMYMSAGEDSGKVESAVKTIKTAIIGLVIIMLAVVIVRFVINVVNMKEKGTEVRPPSATPIWIM